MGRYEENMKRALMRGVCALNLEAMSIFSDETFNNNTNTNSNAARKVFNSQSSNESNKELYYSNEDILNRLDTNINDKQQNEQLFKSSTNNFSRKVNENENLTVSYENRQSANVSSSSTLTKIPTIIIENNKMATNDQTDTNNNKIKINNQTVSVLFLNKFQWKSFNGRVRRI